MKTEISEIKGLISESDSIQNENITLLQGQITRCEERLKALEGNVLYYQYDSESQTLKVYGNTKEEHNNE